MNGFAFTAMVGGVSYSVNLFSAVAEYQAIKLDAECEHTDTPVKFTVSNNSAATPEPSSFFLLGSGLTGMATLLGRLRRD